MYNKYNTYNKLTSIKLICTLHKHAYTQVRCSHRTNDRYWCQWQSYLLMPLAPMAPFEGRHWWSLAPMDNFVKGANDAIVCAIGAIAHCLAPITLSPLAPADLIGFNVIQSLCVTMTVTNGAIRMLSGKIQQHSWTRIDHFLSTDATFSEFGSEFSGWSALQRSGDNCIVKFNSTLNQRPALEVLKALINSKILMFSKIRWRHYHI